MPTSCGAPTGTATGSARTISVVQPTLQLDVLVVVERLGAAPPVSAELLRDPRLREPSRLTVASPSLRRLAAVHRSDPDPLRVAEQVCRQVPGLVRCVGAGRDEVPAGPQARAVAFGRVPRPTHRLPLPDRRRGPGLLRRPPDVRVVQRPRSRGAQRHA